MGRAGRGGGWTTGSRQPPSRRPPPSRWGGGLPLPSTGGEGAAVAATAAVIPAAGLRAAQTAAAVDAAAAPACRAPGRAGPCAGLFSLFGLFLFSVQRRRHGRAPPGWAHRGAAGRLDAGGPRGAARGCGGRRAGHRAQRAGSWLAAGGGSCGCRRPRGAVGVLLFLRGVRRPTMGSVARVDAWGGGGWLWGQRLGGGVGGPR